GVGVVHPVVHRRGRDGRQPGGQEVTTGGRARPPFLKQGVTMSAWRALFEGFTDGVLSVAAYQVQALPHSSGAGTARGRTDALGRLCRERGWSVNEREGIVIQLHFNNPAGGIRKVRIAGGDDCVVTFSAHSFGVIPAQKVPAQVLAYLLRRNIS